MVQRSVVRWIGRHLAVVHGNRLESREPREMSVESLRRWQVFKSDLRETQGPKKETTRAGRIQHEL